MAGPSGAGCAHNHQKAFRDSETRRRRRLVRPPGAQGEPAQHEWLAAPSAKLCAECGYLVPPVIVSLTSNPMRRIENVRVDPDACPHCRERLWIDLAHVPSADLVRQNEIAVVRARSDNGSARWLLGFATVAASSVALLTWNGWMFLPAVLGCGVGMARWLAKRAPRGRRGPRRWHRPALRWRPGDLIARGSIASKNELVAPLSGRPAAAWLVRVRHASGSALPHSRGADHPSWALVEQSVARLDIDGRSTGEGLTLDVEPVRAESLGPDAHRWLRTRGFDPHDHLELFETVIARGDRVELYSDRHGGPPVVRLA